MINMSGGFATCVCDWCAKTYEGLQTERPATYLREQYGWCFDGDAEVAAHCREFCSRRCRAAFLADPTSLAERAAATREANADRPDKWGWCALCRRLRDDGIRDFHCPAHPGQVLADGPALGRSPEQLAADEAWCNRAGVAPRAPEHAAAAAAKPAIIGPDRRRELLPGHNELAADFRSLLVQLGYEPALYGSVIYDFSSTYQGSSLDFTLVRRSFLQTVMNHRDAEAARGR